LNVRERPESLVLRFACSVWKASVNDDAANTLNGPLSAGCDDPATVVVVDDVEGLLLLPHAAAANTSSAATRIDRERLAIDIRTSGTLAVY
jgi:hypothetical protein